MSARGNPLDGGVTNIVGKLCVLIVKPFSDLPSAVLVG